MKYLTRRDLAERLQCSVSTINNLRAARQLPKPVKIGASVRWIESEVDEYLANRRANY